MKSSHGRHGGNQGKNDRHEADQARRRAMADGLSTARDQDEPQGHGSGEGPVMARRRRRGIAGAKQDEDLRRNPGIGQSIGTSQGGDLELIEGENSVEGDIDNNADASGAVKLDPGRTNK